MLAAGKMVGFVHTTDYDKARAFYEGKLGMEYIDLNPFALVMRLAGNTVRISKVNTFTPQQGTILGWDVSGIEAVVTALVAAGVEMEKYPFVEDKELGIWTAPGGDKVAWFKDPDGNVLSVSEHH
jgi:catechol 2,3-dioxygenase-like lactoylglutathione lyase family enzyme